MYKIMAKYKKGEAEEIDEAESLAEARFLCQEYRMAYGSDWKVWIENKKGRKLK